MTIALKFEFVFSLEVYLLIRKVVVFEAFEGPVIMCVLVGIYIRTHMYMSIHIYVCKERERGVHAYIVDMYAKCLSIDKVCELFDKMP